MIFAVEAVKIFANYPWDLVIIVIIISLMYINYTFNFCFVKYHVALNKLYLNFALPQALSVIFSR